MCLIGVNLPADVNADGVVNLLDLTAVAQAIDAAGGGANQLSLQEVELALLIAAEQAVELEAAAGAPGRAVIVYIGTSSLLKTLLMHLQRGEVRCSAPKGFCRA